MDKRKIAKAAVALLMVLGMTLPAAPAVEAANTAGIIGALIGGAVQYKALDSYIDKINNTEEGRQEYFQEMKSQMGVSDNWYYTSMLDSIMGNLSNGVAAYDSKIYEKPFLYFLNNDTTFNASCGLGHVMTVNIGLFSISDNTDEVAFVLAHEMAHGMKDHSVHGTKKKMRTVIGASVAAESMGGGAVANIAMSAVVGQINNVQIGKKQEWEADNLAFDYAYAAGYNPGAGAALWQRVLEKKGEYKNSFVGEIFSPSDHPSHEERRNNYEKKLTTLSGNHVTIKKGTDLVQVNGKGFLTPAATSSMSSTERKYFVMGNLAAAYAHGEANKNAYASGGTVYLGNQAIITPAGDDESAETLARRLNTIK